MALSTMGNLPRLANTWPRRFGHPHMELLMAQIHAMGGDFDLALKIATSATKDAETRMHISWHVQGLAVEAFIHHLSGSLAERDNALNLAQNIAGSSRFSQAFAVNGVDVRQLVRDHSTTLSRPSLPVGVPLESFKSLTAREIQILKLAARKLTNKAIADELCLSISTVKNHLSNINGKLGTRTRKESIEFARRRGLLDR